MNVFVQESVELEATKLVSTKKLDIVSVTSNPCQLQTQK